MRVRAHQRSTEAHVRLGFVTRMRADVSLSGPLGPGGLRRNSPFGTLAMALRAT